MWWICSLSSLNTLFESTRCLGMYRATLFRCARQQITHTWHIVLRSGTKTLSSFFVSFSPHVQLNLLYSDLLYCFSNRFGNRFHRLICRFAKRDYLYATHHSFVFNSFFLGVVCFVVRLNITKTTVDIKRIHLHKQRTN